MMCLAAIAMTALTASAQDKVEGTISTDVVNQYIWRGQDLGTGGFHIGVTDYWFNSPNDKYFAYKAHETSHVFEGNIGYDFGPLAVNWYTNFAGNDGVNKDGDRAYSSYLELAAPFKLASLDWTATVGAVPFSTSFYATANGFAVTNIGLKACKDIEITKSFSVPLFAGIYANPSTQKAYFTFGFTLHP